jgi:hypothetical protein
VTHAKPAAKVKRKQKKLIIRMLSMETKQIPVQQTRAAFVPATLDKDNRTIEITWSVGAQVRRYDWWDGEYFIEELSMQSSAVRLDRLNSGAPFCRDHESESVLDALGVVEKAWITNGVGGALVRFSKRADVEPIYQDVIDGILQNISVGYYPLKMEEQREKRDGMSVFLVTDWEPFELSLVTIPADTAAKVRSGEKTNSVIIETLRGKEMDKDPETQRSATEPAEQPKPAATNNVVDLEQARKASKAEGAAEERERIAAIRTFAKKARGVDDAFVDDLIARGLSASDAQAKILEKWTAITDTEQHRGDTSVTKDERDNFIEAGVQALRARSGLEKMDGGNEFRGMRLTEIAKLCLERGGISVKGMNELEMVKRSFTQSTSDFPVLLETAMHKTLQNAYAIAPDTWSRFCSVGSVSDFRAHNRYRLGSFGNLDSLGELSEFKNKSIPDGERSTITAGTKGNLINISRQTIINDDLSAFINLSAMLGRAGRRTIEADVYALLASNPVMFDGIALFHASHGNLAASGSVVSVASIESSRIAMAMQKDISGNDFLDLRPALWLGGMAAGGQARVTNDAQYDPDTANKLQAPNRVRGLFRDVIDTPRITGTDWYTFADPSEAPVIEVAFLNGEQSPFLDRQDGFEVDGIQWKVRLDYGVAAIDYRGAYRNPGA